MAVEVTGFVAVGPGEFIALEPVLGGRRPWPLPYVSSTGSTSIGTETGPSGPSSRSGFHLTPRSPIGPIVSHNAFLPRTLRRSLTYPNWQRPSSKPSRRCCFLARLARRKPMNRPDTDESVNSHPGGVTAHSRWSSVATPPDLDSSGFCIPEGFQRLG